MKTLGLVKWCLLFSNVCQGVPGLRRRQAGSSSDFCTCPVNGPVTTTSTPVTTLTTTVTTQDGTVTSTGSTVTSVVTSSSTSTITVTIGTTTITYPGVTRTTTASSTTTRTITATVTQTTCTTRATRKVKRQNTSSMMVTTTSATDPPATITTVITSDSTLCTCTCTYVPTTSTLASSSSCSCPATTSTITFTASTTNTIFVTETATTPTVVIITPEATSTSVVTSFETSSELATATTTQTSLTITSQALETVFTTVTATFVTCPPTSSTSTSATPLATQPLICNSTAYLIGTLNNVPTLYNIDLATSYYFVVNGRVGNGAYTAINAMGYNVLDNYLYAVGQVSTSINAVIRISATGVTQEIARFSQANAPTAGDIDTDGQFWITAAAGTQWRHIDLDPGSTTYGQTINNGTSTLTGYNVYDMVYLPGQGDYMWSLAQSTASSPRLGIIRWSQTTHVWSEYQSDGNTPAPNPIIANWGSPNSTIWGLAATSGNVTRQTLGGNPVAIGTAPGTLSYADGARCALAT